MDEEKMQAIHDKYKNSTYLPKWVWIVVLVLMIAIFAILIWLHYLPA